MIFPHISGITCTDEHGVIDNCRGQPISHGSPYENFDRSVFQAYMREMVNDRTLIVTGDNNFRQMKSVISDRCHFLISDKNRDYRMVQSVDLFENRRNMTEIPQPKMINLELVGNGKNVSKFSAIEEALNRQLENIVVLGGSSVYKMFTDCYDHFVRVEISRNSNNPKNYRCPGYVHKTIPVSSNVGGIVPNGRKVYTGFGVTVYEYHRRID